MFKGIIFDMDGTLTVPEIDFEFIRKELEVEDNIDLLEYPKQLSPKEQTQYFTKLEKLERESYKNLKFQPGLPSALNKLLKHNIKLSIITRNCKKNTEFIIRKLNVNFSPILTREFDFVKPNPEPINYILSKWQINKEEAIIVGDFRDDILCGKNAGIKTCFFQNNNKPSYSDIADYTISNFFEFENIILH